jgi:hypothetical protein
LSCEIRKRSRPIEPISMTSIGSGAFSTISGSCCGAEILGDRAHHQLDAVASSMSDWPGRKQLGAQHLGEQGISPVSFGDRLSSACSPNEAEYITTNPAAAGGR